MIFKRQLYVAGLCLVFGAAAVEAHEGLGAGDGRPNQPLQVCDPADPTACGENRFCKTPMGKCGDQNAQGVCARVPAECPDSEAPVCGCDGQTYRNRCEAMRARVSIQHLGRCRQVCHRDNATMCPAGQYCAIPPGMCDNVEAEGLCLPVPRECPDRFNPVCGCDGRTYPNRCAAASHGVSIAHLGRCHELCHRGSRCDEGEYCQFPPGTCNFTDVVGMCKPIPDGCPDVYEPVCGCDGMTYGNRCEAAMAGVSILHPGECDLCDRSDPSCGDGQCCWFPPGTCDENGRGECLMVPDACPAISEPVCGCDGMTYGNRCEAMRACVSIDYDGECDDNQCDRHDPSCGEGEFCLFRDGTCRLNDVAGECVPRPEVCPEVYDPVCGCDGVTYPNRCYALRAGVSVARPGECDRVCGGIQGLPCVEGEFCKLPSGQCNSADLQGICVPLRDPCPNTEAPVCGCDGQTYRNPCAAWTAGVQIDHRGPCRD